MTIMPTENHEVVSKYTLSEKSPLTTITQSINCVDN